MGQEIPWIRPKIVPLVAGDVVGEEPRFWVLLPVIGNPGGVGRCGVWSPLAGGEGWAACLSRERATLLLLVGLMSR